MLALAAAWAAPSAASDSKPLEAKLHRLEGGKVKLSELVQGPTLLELWASWCLPCREQSRVLGDLEAELEERGVTVLALNVGEKPEVAAEHLEREPSPFPVLLDRVQAVSTRLRIAELPALVLLDAERNVVGTALGLTDAAGVSALLDLLAEP